MGGDLQLSSIKKQHPEDIYFHEQTPKARRPRAERGRPDAFDSHRTTSSGGGIDGAPSGRGGGEIERIRRREM